MPHPIFEIDELLRLVIDELVENNRRTAVSFALTCQSFEEPTLSSLWKKQTSFALLVEVLPTCTSVDNEYGGCAMVGGRDFPTYHISYQFPQTIEHDPSAEDLARLQRYASWMRELHLGLDRTPTTGALLRLSRILPDGPLFPMLKQLHWDLRGADSALGFSHLFLSQNLQHVTLYVTPSLFSIPRGRAAVLVQAISSLPTSLEELFVMCSQGREESLKGAISSFICRCGPSLRSFGTFLPLSETAIHHLMQLPNLSYWRTIQGPPQVPTSIPPSLEKLRFDKQEALPWLHFLASRENNALQKGSALATSHIGGTLRHLEYPRGTIIDPTLLSSIVKFKNLVVLRVYIYNCSGAVSCSFRMTDGNMEDLATALPRLEELHLGEACCSNICKTTIASLMSISVHCLGLTVLEIHFNTRTIVSDVQYLLGGDAERNKAKCKLQSLSTGTTPLEVRGRDVQTVAMGLKVIFPCLTNLTGFGEGWQRARSQMKG